MNNWQHGNGEGSAERTVTIVSIIVIVLIVVWRVAVFVGDHPELKGLFQ